MSNEQQREPEDLGADAAAGEQSELVDADSSMTGQLAEAEREKDQFKKMAQRAQADLVNYRNRVRSEQEALQARTTERVAGRFIEIADQLEKALEPEAASGVDEQWVSGVKAIYHNLLNVLKLEGFERFDSEGEEFDPRRHDALLVSPTHDHPHNHVIRQLAAGYVRTGEVVRPAQVEIASTPDDAGGAEADDEDTGTNEV